MPPIRMMLFLPGYIFILFCVEEAQGTDWTMAYSRLRKHVIAKNRLLTTLPKLTKEWRVSFDVNPTSFSRRMASVLHMTIGGKGSGSGSRVGDRIPAIWFHKTKGTLVSTALNGKVSYNMKGALPLPGEWTRIEVSQTLVVSKYMFNITIGGEQVFTKQNTKPVELSDVKVYAGSPWYSGQKGSLRKLKIETKTTDCATGETHFHF